MEAAIIENTKICTGCKIEMLATKEFFGIKKGGKYGLRSRCKKCKKAFDGKYRIHNAKKIKKRNEKWRKENPEKVKEHCKKYRENNIEKCKESIANWRKNNSEKYNENKKKWKKENPEKAKDIRKKANRKNVKNLVDSYVADLLKTPIKHLNPQIIETRRLIILIKRELRKNNFKTLETMQEDSTNKNNSQMENNLKENDNKRDLNFEVKNSDDLNKMLSGFLMDVRRGSVTHYSANSINLVADKINKNNLNQLEYKRLSGGNKKIDFFEKE
jgi:hypothetical protein